MEFILYNTVIKSIYYTTMFHEIKSFFFSEYFLVQNIIIMNYENKIYFIEFCVKIIVYSTLFIYKFIFDLTFYS